MRGSPFIPRSLVLLLTCTSLVAHAAPQVVVRDRTEIELLSLEKTQEGIQVSGALRETGSGNPVVGAFVALSLSGRTVQVATNELGVFQFNFPNTKESNSLRAVFLGSDVLDGAERKKENIRASKRNPNLLLEETPTETLPSFLITATSQGEPLHLSATISIAGSDGPFFQKSVSIKADGGTSFTPTKEDVPKPGYYQLRVESNQSDLFNSASSSIRFSRNSATSLTLAQGPKQRRNYVFSGRLTDDLEQGIANALVALQKNGKTIDESLTNADGNFSFSVDRDEFPSLKHLTASYTTTQPFLKSSKSPVLLVSEIQSPGINFTLLLSTFVVSMLVSGAYFWSTKRKVRVSTPPKTLAVTRGVAPRPKPKRGRPKQLAVSGTIRDAVKGRTVSGAFLTARSSQVNQQTVSDSRGQFTFQELPPGAHLIHCTHDDYDDESFTAVIPHRGEWSQIELRLRPLRECIFDVYKDTCAPLLPTKRAHVLTPRQTLAHVKQHPLAEKVEEFTDFIEETYFGRTTVDKGHLAKARELSKSFHL